MIIITYDQYRLHQIIKYNIILLTYAIMRSAQLALQNSHRKWMYSIMVFLSTLFFLGYLKKRHVVILPLLPLSLYFITDCMKGLLFFSLLVLLSVMILHNIMGKKRSFGSCSLILKNELKYILKSIITVEKTMGNYSD